MPKSIRASSDWPWPWKMRMFVISLVKMPIVVIFIEVVVHRPWVYRQHHLHLSVLRFHHPLILLHALLDYLLTFLAAHIYPRLLLLLLWLLVLCTHPAFHRTAPIENGLPNMTNPRDEAPEVLLGLHYYGIPSLHPGWTHILSLPTAILLEIIAQVARFIINLDFNQHRPVPYLSRMVSMLYVPVAIQIVPWLPTQASSKWAGQNETVL